MIIRPATIWDAEKISDLWLSMHEEITVNKSLLEESSNAENLFINVITRTKLSEWCILVAEERGDIYGFMMGTACYPRYNPCHVLGVVEALYVRPEKRGIGIFKELIDKMFEWAATKNIKHVEFLSMCNAKVAKLYDRLGYEPVMVTYRKKEADNGREKL